MPEKSDKQKKINEISPIVKQVDVEEKEKVISVRIPKKKETKKANKEEKVEKEDKKEDNGKPKSETKVAKVSSFSMLDSNKEDMETNPVEDATTDKPKEKKVEDDTPADARPQEETNENMKGKAESKDENNTTDEIKKWLDETKDEVNEDEEKGSKTKFFVIALVVAIVLGVVGGGIYFYKSNIEKAAEVEDEPQTVLIPTATPEPTQVPVMEEEEVDLSLLSVQVLNGSGVAGAAGKGADALKDEGFGTTNAANAASQDFTQTIVVLNTETPESVFTSIKAALGSDYELNLSKDKLQDGSEYDVQITLGSKKPEPTAEVTSEE